MNSDIETGISIMKIVEKLDAGPVMKKIKIKINELSTTEEISKSLSKISAKSIVKILDDIFNKKLKFINQNHKLATYAKKIEKSEAKINWNESAKEILAKINGLNPSPGAWFIYKETRYKIWRAKIVEMRGTSGAIIDKKFTVGCGDKSLEFIEIQKEGKNRLSLKNFLTGIVFNQGDELR
jgi:methionyl-tRNA formyltransferase